jgi:prepilin-type processing-associated H-X9-DG protein
VTDQKWTRWAWIAVAVGIAWTVLFFGFSSVTDPREHVSVTCKGNLKQIGLALYLYHEKYGSFPPAYVADEKGDPAHSWRTLLLPFMERHSLYKEYRFDEPWDGPNNSKLENGIPVIRCPFDPTTRGRRTNYVAVVGPNTAWPGLRPANLKDDFPDGAENTILVVEVADSGIDWIEPRDLAFDDMNFQLNGPGKSISSQHKKKGSWPWNKDAAVVNVLFADGHVEILPVDTAPETIRALLTANGGEEVKRRP